MPQNEFMKGTKGILKGKIIIKAIETPFLGFLKI